MRKLTRGSKPTSPAYSPSRLMGRLRKGTASEKSPCILSWLTAAAHETDKQKTRPQRQRLATCQNFTAAAISRLIPCAAFRSVQQQPEASLSPSSSLLTRAQMTSVEGQLQLQAEYFSGPRAEHTPVRALVAVRPKPAIGAKALAEATTAARRTVLSMAAKIGTDREFPWFGGQ